MSCLTKSARNLRNPATLAILVLLLVTYCFVSILIYGTISPLLIFYSGNGIAFPLKDGINNIGRNLRGQYVDVNTSDIYEIMEYDVVEPWIHRFGNRRPPPMARKKKKPKSKYVQKCPAEFLNLVQRDLSIKSNIYIPSKDINYTSLRDNFWNNLIKLQESQLNNPNTLKNISKDFKLKNQGKGPGGRGGGPRSSPSDRWSAILSQQRTRPSKKVINAGNNNNELNEGKCLYNGRVFGIGIYKTGTTSLSLALGYLGYIDNYKTSIYKWLKPYFCNYSHWYLILRHYYDYMQTVTSINNNQILFDVLTRSQRSFNFGDVPMLYFWPFFDRWYPNSKYILTKRNSTAKYVNSVMKFCVQLQECMNWIFYDMDNNQNNAKSLINDGQNLVKTLFRYFTKKQNERKQIKTNDNNNKNNNTNSNSNMDIKQIENYNWTELTLREYRWNKDDEVNGEQIAHYIAMIYEQWNERIMRYFKENNKMNDLLIINIDKMDDHKMWKAIMEFLGCENDKILNIKYPHVNPTKKMFSKIQLIPDDYNLDWRTFFKNKIPIMMTTHTPVRKIWFEYQDGDYDQLL